MGLVTVFCPLMTTGNGELVVQTAGETKFVVNSKVNPEAMFVHVTMTLVPERMMFSRGANTKARLNTLPLADEESPPSAVPYRVLPDKITLPSGEAPSLPPEKL